MAAIATRDGFLLQKQGRARNSFEGKALPCPEGSALALEEQMAEDCAA